MPGAQVLSREQLRTIMGGNVGSGEMQQYVRMMMIVPTKRTLSVTIMEDFTLLPQQENVKMTDACGAMRVRIMTIAVPGASRHFI